MKIYNQNEGTTQAWRKGENLNGRNNSLPAVPGMAQGHGNPQLNSILAAENINELMENRLLKVNME